MKKSISQNVRRPSDRQLNWTFSVGRRWLTCITKEKKKDSTLPGHYQKEGEDSFVTSSAFAGAMMFRGIEWTGFLWLWEKKIVKGWKKMG